MPPRPGIALANFDPQMFASQSAYSTARADGTSSFDDHVATGSSLLSNRDFHQLYDKDTVNFAIRAGDSITFSVSPMGAAVGTLSQGSTTIDIPLGAALTMTFQAEGTLTVGVQFLDYVHRDSNGRTKASNVWRKPQPSEAGQPGAPTTRGGISAKRIGGQKIQTELGAVPVMVTDSATPGAQVEAALEKMTYAQFGGELRKAAPADLLDDVQFALDIIGVFDQTGFADVASGVIAVARGDWTAALLSLAATIPVLGAAAIIPKAVAYLTKKGFGKLAKAVTSNFSSISGKCWAVLQGTIGAVSAAIRAGRGVLDAVTSWFGRVADDLAALLRREEDALVLADGSRVNMNGHRDALEDFRRAGGSDKAAASADDLSRRAGLSARELTEILERVRWIRSKADYLQPRLAERAGQLNGPDWASLGDSGRRALEDSLTSCSNGIRDHLDTDDIAGAMNELAGGKTEARGRLWNHVKEVSDARAAIEGARENIIRWRGSLVNQRAL
jgi:uncharacterized membrane protein